MQFLRPLMIVAVVLGAILFATSHTPHHETDSPFLALFNHLVPATLVDDPHGAARPLLELDVPGPAIFDVDQHESPEHQKPGTQIVLTNLQVFQLAALLLIVVCCSGIPGYLRTGKGDYITRLFAGTAHWVRDEMVYPAMGKENGRRLLPYFLALFFFILFMNLLGLLPGAATATANIFVTGGLAVLTLIMMVFGGMIAQGPVAYWKNLVPHVPWFLWPLMFGIEVMGLVIKPAALTIRLFANMTGGHMVVLSFMGLLFFMAGAAGHTATWAASPLVVAFAVFIMIIESFVALLQAYVFALLSILFVQASLHPEH